tara:strand:+ start:165 stop:680 length:516 start_codon:yes stop_codon:yes gene_type:complete
MIIVIHFPFELNVSLQVGDMVYYVPYDVNSNVTSNSANLPGEAIGQQNQFFVNTTPIGSNVAFPIEIGTVQEMGFGQYPGTPNTTFGNTSLINPITGASMYVQWITIDTSTVTSGHAITTVPAGAMLMFSKDNKVNLSTLSGYYALAEFKNNSKVRAEMFAVNAQMQPSSN